MFASRIIPTLILLIAGSFIAPAQAAKTPQEKEFAARCKTGLATIQSSTKARLSLFTTQIDAYAKAVEIGQKTPIQGVDLVATEAADCLADVLQYAVDETMEVRTTAVTLLGQLGSVRPLAFQAGTGSTLDQYHASVTKQLEKARAKVEKALLAYTARVSEATDGGFEHRIVVPSLGQFVLADPNANDSNGALDDDLHPSRILVIITAGSKSVGNDGYLVIAGQTFANPFDPIKPDIAISTVIAHPKIAASMDQRGVWQCSFSNLTPANIQVWVEEDATHSAAIGDAGSLLIQVISVP